MLITEFFENQEIFITGGSGFIGKALIEKTLRSCPGVGKVFVLLRSKKGKNAEERLRDILATSLFNRLRDEQPQTFQKVYAIEGDCSELGLGISDEDLEKIKNVSIIYHSAASVRFDDALSYAVLLNTRGTFELVKIAQTLKNLKSFVHVSTTYCNPDKHVVEEKVYPPYADWRTTIKIAETYSTETLNILNLKYGGNQPNTYTFTKSLSEQIINEYKDKLPVVIFRPSIVISSLIEPVPGWVDNFNGPVGILIGCGIGLLRTNYGDPDNVSDFVPIDIVIKAMIIACYKRGLTELNSQDDNQLEVFNCASANEPPITASEIVELGKKLIKENPMQVTLWVPGGYITRCPAWNYIKVLVLHILMAIVADCVLSFTNIKISVLKIQRRIYAANLALHVFVTTTWIFKNDNFMALDSNVPEEEFDKFAFKQFSNVVPEDFFRQAIRGAKEFLLNEPPDSTQGARLRLKAMQVIQFLIMLFGALLFAHFVLKYVLMLFV